MSRLVRVPLIVALMAGLLSTGSPAIVAECTALDPWPSFTTAVPTARDVFVGTVAKAPRAGPRFTLRVDEVLRGRAPAEIEFAGFQSGMPLSVCPRDSDLEVRRVGDRLAFAMEARMPGVPGRIDAVAFVGDSRPDRFAMPGMERVPLRTVRRLAGREPDGSDARRPYPVGPSASGLVTRRVAPGVGRIVESYAARDLDDVRYLAIDPWGTAWAGTQAQAFRFGEGALFDRKDGLPRRLTGLTATGDATVLAEGWGPLMAFDRGQWTALDPEHGRGTDYEHPVAMRSGAIWAVARRGVTRHDEEGWTHFGWPAMDPPCTCLVPPLGDGSCTCWVVGLAEAPDGSTWVGFRGIERLAGPFQGGLRLYDGQSWSAAPPPLGGEPYSVTDLVAGPDGPVWASILPADAEDPYAADSSRAFLAHWDGLTWTAYAWPAWMARERQREAVRQMTVGPDGRLWFSGALTSFDGTTWRQYAVPARAPSERPRVLDLAVAPEGTAWIVVRDLIKYGTSRPDGIYVIDPDEAEPIATEAATVIEPSREPGP
jgi:hypothetical protein